MEITVLFSVVERAVRTLWPRPRLPEYSARVAAIASKTRSFCSPCFVASPLAMRSRSLHTPCGSKPSGAFCACQKLFNVNPAPASRTIASAACVNHQDRTAYVVCLSHRLALRPPASCSASEMDFRVRDSPGRPDTNKDSGQHSRECGEGEHVQIDLRLSETAARSAV